MDFLTEEIIEELSNIYKNTNLSSNDIPNEDTENVQQQDSASKIDEILSKVKEGTSDHLKLLSMKASIYYEKAKACLARNLFEKSKDHLEKAVALIKDLKDNPQVTFLYLRVINYLSYVLSRTGDLETAKNILEQTAGANTNLETKVYSTEDLFYNRKVDENIAKFKLNKLLLNNMQMLGWIYGKLGLTDLYADMVHKGLQKELDINDGDAVQWAVRCYRLASLFLAQSKWQNARYHLTASQVVLDPLELGLNPNIELHKAQADLARVWVNYGLHLFSVSKKAILEKIWDETDCADDVDKSKEPENIDNFVFSGLEVSLPNIPTKEIKTLQEAKDLFAHTHRWLKRARLFYTLRDFPIQYVNIILELSELYRFLAFYESDVDAKYLIQKKRYEALETLSAILKEVRPNCYAAVSIEIVREIIEVQLDMMSLNLKKIYNPADEKVVDQEDITKRIETITDIHNKIETLCNDVTNPEIEFSDTEGTEMAAAAKESTPKVEVTGEQDEVTEVICQKEIK